MSSVCHHNRFISGFLCLCLMLGLVLLASGCTQPAATPPVVTPVLNTTPAPPPAQTTPGVVEGKQMVTLTEADNGKTTDITQNTRFAVALDENPTTGFMWNATLSPGLELQSSDFSQRPAAPNMVGVGGTRTWIILAKNMGNQTFSAVYLRSWEPVTGNETAYNTNIRVVSP